jgi:hypothetical protein
MRFQADTGVSYAQLHIGSLLTVVRRLRNRTIIGGLPLRTIGSLVTLLSQGIVCHRV